MEARQPGLASKGQVSGRLRPHCLSWHAGLWTALREEVQDCSQTRRRAAQIAAGPPGSAEGGGFQKRKYI